MSEKPWVALWKQDLLSSLNYQSLAIYEKGIYTILFTLCRDDEYIGQLCYPNGNPMTLDQIIDTMDIKRGDRRDKIKEVIEVLIDKGLLFWNDHKRLEIRKYAEKTQLTQCNLIESTKSARSQHKVSEQHICISESESESESKSERDMHLSLFTHWNGLPNVLHHKALTDKMKRAINGRLAEGYTADDIRQMMSNYAEILAGGLEVPPRYRWTFRWGLIDFLARHKDRFNDLEVARQNFREREDNRVQCSECSGTGKEKIQGTEQRCHKCGGKGFHPDPKLMRKE